MIIAVAEEELAYPGHGCRPWTVAEIALVCSYGGAGDKAESGIEGVPRRTSKRVDPIVESAIDIFDGKIIGMRSNNTADKR